MTMTIFLNHDLLKSKKKNKFNTYVTIVNKKYVKTRCHFVFSLSLMWTY